MSNQVSLYIPSLLKAVIIDTIGGLLHGWSCPMTLGYVADHNPNLERISFFKKVF